MEERIRKIEERLDLVEFRQELLFEESNVSRYLFECNVNKRQYKALMNLMEEIRVELDNHREVSHHSYEQKVYVIVNARQGDYHFCEDLARSFMEDERWEEVFPALYGKLDKYNYLMETLHNKEK